MSKSLEERIIHLEHQNQIMLKYTEQIKEHLWAHVPKNRKDFVEFSELELQEAQAEKYVEGVIIPKSQEAESEIGIKGFWQGAILNYLKQQTLNFIGTVLKKLAIEKLVELSKFLLDNLQEQIINLYNQANEEEKEIFKNKLQEVYPDSDLLKELN